MKTLGDRMKEYENAYRIKMPKKLPIIIRLDGKAFHTLTRSMEKPFDLKFVKIMNWIAMSVTAKIQGAVFGYTQSDEISILIYPWRKPESESWFDNNIQKMVSISAAYASSWFNLMFQTEYGYDPSDVQVFDSRVFVLPDEEIINYFIWRQNDIIRNSVQMLGQAHFSSKQLHGKKIDEVKEMLISEKNLDWHNLDNHFKYGTSIKNGETDLNTPIFSNDRRYIGSTVW